MNKQEFIKMLGAGSVNFAFIKKDGTLRSALGTLNMELIPSEGRQFATPADEQRQSPDHIIKYFDMEKLAWRSATVSSIIEVEGGEVQL